MAWRKLAWMAVLIVAASAVPAGACSVVHDYVRPSNFELVQIADAIVIAAAEAQTGEGAFSAVTFRVESAIKGTPPERIELDMAALGAATPSDLADLSGSHPEGHGGPCNRMIFARGERYLLFIERGRDGGWRQLGFPFSRVNEDYAGEDNAWMRSVRRYLLLQRTLPPMEQIAALRRIVETGRDRDGALLSDAERADIVDHLGSISQWKPTAYLLDIHARLERGEPLSFATRPDAANREAGDIDRIAALLLDRPMPVLPEGAERERLLVLRALAMGDHPDALPLFDRLAAAPQTNGAVRGLVLRYLARNGQYSRAYRWIETRLLAELSRLPADEARALIADVAEVQRGDSLQEGQERWRTDPHAAANWPELALALYWYQVRAFGQDEALAFFDALDAIAVADYRARPDLAIARGANFDEDVERWALAELARPPREPPDPSEGAENGGADRGPAPDLLPLRVLVSSWVADREPALHRAFCQGGERRRLVILALGRWGDGLYRHLLAPMAATPGLSAEERSWLLRAEIEMTARDIGEPGRRTFQPGDEDEWLLTRIIRGEPPAGPPLACPAGG